MAKQKDKSVKILKKSWHPWVSHIVITTGYGSLFFFLILNILFSQRLPQLYFDLISQKPEPMITFLKQSKNIPEFSLYASEIEEQVELHKDEIYYDEDQRKELIQKLEALLIQNPQSRDVLYSLYLLYDKQGDHMNAQKYLQQAKIVDPGI